MRSLMMLQERDRHLAGLALPAPDDVLGTTDAV
jgi:hypothetical protein